MEGTHILLLEEPHKLPIIRAHQATFLKISEGTRFRYQTFKGEGLLCLLGTVGSSGVEGTSEGEEPGRHQPRGGKQDLECELCFPRVRTSHFDEGNRTSKGSEERSSRQG